MESLTKNTQTPECIRAMTERAFGKNALIDFTEFSEGYFNAAYLVRLKNDAEAVLKIAPKDGVRILHYERDIIYAETDALKLVRAKTRVPVPELYFFDESREVCDSPYFFMERMPGIGYDKLAREADPAVRREIELEIGRYNYEINSITGEAFGNGRKRFADWADAYYALVSDLLLDGREADVELPLSYDSLEELICSSVHVCGAVKRPALVHWDLWPGNVLTDGAHVTGIIDFERALWGDPLMEYYFGGVYDNANFCEGYAEDLFSGKDAGARRILYDLYLYLVMKIECAYRKYPNNRQDEWASGKIAETVAKLERAV